MPAAEEKMSEVILRVLSGPNIGAQVALLEQPLVIGTSDEADIMLADPHIAAKHCQIQLSGKSSAAVKALDGGFYVDGKKGGESATITSGQVLTLGSTHIAIGPSNAAWPTLRLPDLREIEQPTRAAQSSSTAPNAKSRKPKLPVWIIPTVLIVALSVTVGAFIWTAAVSAKHAKFDPYQQLQFQQTFRQNTQKYEIELSAKIREKLPDVMIDYSEKNNLRTMFIWGNDLEQLSRARGMVNKLGAPMPVEIVNLDALRTSLEALVSMFGYALQPEVAPGGIVTWTGYLPSTADWQQFESRFETDAPLVRTNIVNVAYGTRLREQIEKILMGHGIISGVTINVGKTQVEVTGSVSEALLGEIRTDLTALPKKGIGYIKDNLQVGDNSPLPSQLLGSPITGVFVGDLSWVALANGQRLFVGARLPGGFSLQRIQRDRIELQGPSGPLIIPVQIKDAGAQASPAP